MNEIPQVESYHLNSQENNISYLAFKVRESRQNFEHWQRLHLEAIQAIGKLALSKGE